MELKPNGYEGEDGWNENGNSLLPIYQIVEGERFQDDAVTFASVEDTPGIVYICAVRKELDGSRTMTRVQVRDGKVVAACLQRIAPGGWLSIA